MSVQRIDGNPRMSKVVVHGDTVYLAGLTADKTLGQSLAEQTREILSLIDGFLAKAGTDKSKLLTATIWLSDIRTVDEMNIGWLDFYYISDDEYAQVSKEQWPEIVRFPVAVKRGWGAR